jgi:hypothetical protein
MGISILLIILIRELASQSFQIGRLDIWESSDKSKKIFSYKEGAKLSPTVVLNDQSYAEAEILNDSGEKVKPSQVALLFTDESTGAPTIGAHPSVQVGLKTSSAGGSIFRSQVSVSGMRTANPKGGLFSVSLLVGDDTGHLMQPLGKVTVPPNEGRLAAQVDDDFLPLPSIQHTFKPAAVTANPLITTVFTILTATVPSVIFVTGVRALHLNLKGLANPTSIVFFACALIFGLLMVMFFAALNLVQTVAGVIILLVPMSFIGNRLLSQIRASGDLSY